MRLPVAAILFSLFLIACSKNNEQPEEGYYQKTVYKNELTVPVEMIRGQLYRRAPVHRDTIVFIDTIKIEAGGSHEEEVYHCTENCPAVYYTSVVESFPISKIIIGNGLRVDTACTTKAYLQQKQFFKCDELLTGAPNIHDWSQFRETKDPKGHLIQREYVFNAKDLESVTAL